MRQKETKIFGIRISALVEILCFFIFMFLLSIFLSTSFNYFTVSPHPFWILVILISAQYGTVEGLIAATVSTLVLLGGTLPPHNILQEQSEYFFLIAKIPMLWFLTALILGELRMKHIRERDQLRMVANEAEAREKKLAESYEALKKIKERLEVRMASETQTTLMVVDALKKLEKSKKEEIVNSASDLVKILVSPEKYSIYLLEGPALKQVFSAGWDEDHRYAKTFTAESTLYQQIIGRGRSISLTTSDPKILGNEGVLAVPILAPGSGAVKGMIKVEQIPFQRLKLSTIESLNMIGKWVGEAYER